MKCEAGDRCVIIGDSVGCESNIGATVTVTRLVVVPGTMPVWHFKDASRPIIGDFDNPDLRISSTEEGFPTHEFALFDHNLLPIIKLGESRTTAAEMAL